MVTGDTRLANGTLDSRTGCAHVSPRSAFAGSPDSERVEVSGVQQNLPAEVQHNLPAEVQDEVEDGAERRSDEEVVGVYLRSFCPAFAPVMNRNAKG